MNTAKPNRRRGYFVWIVVGLLTTHVAGMMTAVYIAVGDRTFVPLPDYYGKSIRWDQSQEVARKSAELGWERTFTFTRPNDKGERAITVRVVDKASGNVVGLQTRATVYPELFPNQVQDVSFADNGDGSYTAKIAATAHGPLVIDLKAQRGVDTFVTKATLMLGSGS